MPVSTINRWIISGLLFTAGIGVFRPACADSYTTGWYRELQISIAGEDNVDHAWLAPDRKPDTVGTLSLGLGHTGMIGNAGRLIFSGYLQYSNYAQTDNISVVSTSLGARYTFQITPGFSAPWYNASLRLTHLDHHDSHVRNGNRLSLSASINKRLTGRLTGHLGYRFNNLVTSEQGSPFDVAHHQAFVGLEYVLADKAWLYGDVTMGRGSFTSSAAGTRLPDSWGYDAASLDPALAHCTNTGCSVWWAYRYKGSMNGVKVGVAFSLHGVDYDVSGRFTRVRSDAGHSYHARSLLLGAAWDF